jgi:NAD+ synthase (glutamine-hydrolysing)
MKGFARVSVAVPSCTVGDAQRNASSVLELWRRADAQESAVVVFPELALSSYTARDLFLDRHLLDRCEAALSWLAEEGRGLAPLAIVGLPLRHENALYNVAAIIQGGRVLGVVPKAYLPNYREFEERRWFRSGREIPAGAQLDLGGASTPIGMDLLFRADGVRDLTVGVEICEDLWVQVPPSAHQVSAGATVCVNLSASNFLIGKSELRRMLALSASDRGKCAYVYVAAGPGESSTDLAFDSDGFICENGQELAATQRFARAQQLVSVDVDLEQLVHERIATGTFGDCAHEQPRSFRRVGFLAREAEGLLRKVSPHPFLPPDEATLARRCWEIFEIQTNALLTRLAATGHPKLVLGLSGGLDSTHAALVCAATLDLAGRARSDLLCVLMPGFGTSASTRENALQLARSLGAGTLEIGIADASRLVLEQTGHPAAQGTTSVEDLLARLALAPSLGDTTFENVQARLRTLLLMTLANQHAGIVVGTGDLSEKALGWSTYSGDHIAMYDVNAGVPKTLIQFVIRWVVRERFKTWAAADAEQLKRTLEAILDTPISPELLPPSAEGQIAQLSEGTLGPYELHDFFLFHFVRHGQRPLRILELARAAFGERYALPELRRWLRLFFERFFHNQFKRSCTADAPKVGMVALSPRADWRMPSDAEVRSWLEEIEDSSGDARGP